MTNAIHKTESNGDTPRAEQEARTSFGWLPKAAIVIPAFNAEASIGRVVRELSQALPELEGAIFVVDDGSTDATGDAARAAGAVVIAEAPNRGKGVALRVGFEAAKARGFTVALTVDADGQHPPEEARRVLLGAEDERALVLGVRDLERDGAPRANRVSNGISNYFLSLFSGTKLADTQCGLRRYPIDTTLHLGVRGRGYDFEAETLMRAVWAGVPIVERRVRVLYPADRTTHFKVSRDPWRILGTVLATTAEHWMSRARRRR